MPHKKAALITAVLFFFFWLIVLYAGADHPPPPGFIFIILLILACALAVYLRVPTYINWYTAQKENRLRLVLRDGLLAGLAAGLVPLLSSAVRAVTGGAADSAKSADLVIWFAVLGVFGMANALLIFFANAFFAGRRI